MEKNTILYLNLILGLVFGFFFVSNAFSLKFMREIEAKVNDNNVLKVFLLIMVMFLFVVASLINTLLKLPMSTLYIDAIVIIIGAVIIGLTYFTKIQYFKNINYFFFMVSMWMTLRCFYSVYFISTK